MLRHDRTISIDQDVKVADLIGFVMELPEEILRIVVADKVDIGGLNQLPQLQEKAKTRKKRLVFYLNNENLSASLSQHGFLVKPKDSSSPGYFRTLAEGSFLNKSVSDIVSSSPKSRTKTQDIRSKAQMRPSQRQSVRPAKQTMERGVPAKKTAPTITGPELQPTLVVVSEPLSTPSWKKILRNRSRRFYLITFVVLVLIVILLVSSFPLASAEITVTAKREIMPVELKIAANTEIRVVDPVVLKIPAQFFKLERSGTAKFPSTGQANIQQKARGRITIYNNYSSSPQPLVASTRFRSPDGKIFRIIQGVTVPGARVEEGKIVPSSIIVEVEADQPGPDFNIGPARFTIPGFEGSPKFDGFYAQSAEVMSGGASGIVPEVTSQDLANAAQRMQDEIFAQLEKALQAQLPPGATVIEQAKSINIDSLKFSVKSGERVSDFEGQIKATMEVLVFREQDLTDLANQSLAGRLTDQNQVEKLSQFGYTAVVFNPSNQTLTFTAATDAILVWKVDTTKVVQRVKGRSELEIRNALSQIPSVQKARVTFWPFWRSSAPNKENRIKVAVE